MTYTPLFLPGNTVSMTAKTDVSAGQAVKISDRPWTVEPSTAPESKALGVAGRAAKAGEKTPVYFGRLVHRLPVGGVVKTGGEVRAGEGGKLQGESVTTGPVWGYALEPGNDTTVAIIKL